MSPLFPHIGYSARCAHIFYDIFQSWKIDSCVIVIKSFADGCFDHLIDNMVI